MRPTHTIIVATMFTLGCDPTALLDKPLDDLDDVASVDKVAVPDAGYFQAREALDDRLERDGDRVHPDVDRRVSRELSDLIDQGCEPIAYMIATWTNTPETYEGALFNLDGYIGVRTKGFHAPVTNAAGAFAGQWFVAKEPKRPIGVPVDPIDPIDPIDPTDPTDPTDPDISDEDGADEHVVDANGEIIICTSGEHDRRKDTERPTRIAGPMGGTFAMNHRVVGALSHDGTLYPMQGIWDRTHDNGGYAVTIISACD